MKPLKSSFKRKFPRVVSISSKDTATTYLRSATIGPESVNANQAKVIFVHNGHKFVPVRIRENLIGFKFGQFALTKKRVFHKK